MKVSLVVAQGVHQGKVISIPVAEFVIGREEGCHLRPSSPAISKKHFAIINRGAKVFVKDFGSTNGTFVNDLQVTGEVEVKEGDKIRAGPLEFTLKLQQTVSPSRIEKKPVTSAAAADAPTPPPKEAPTKESPTVAGAATAEDDPEKLAALLLATDDGPPGPITADQIPAGSTVFELPAVNPDDPNQAAAKKAAPPADADNSKRAAEILKKYMQRPRT